MKKVGFIGLGLMGTAMVEKLLNVGHRVFIYNRTKQKAEKLISQGAIWCESPADVATKTELIFSMISTPDVLQQISLGATGILSTLKPKAIHIDCSTVSPEVVRQLEKEYKAKSCYFLHSPVLGGVAQINAGSLLLFVGGNKEAYIQAKPILKTFSSTMWHFEHIEQATITKLICNSFIAGMVTILAQSFVLAEKTDIPLHTLLEIIGQSQLAAPMFQVKGKAMIERNFDAMFYIEHILKDTNLVLETAKSLNTPFPIGTVTQELFSEAVKSGFAKEDYSAILKILESRAGSSVS
jgi:3-hydroxyisobutyrate dehydrogenase